MSDRQYREKEAEKEEEKRHEKQDEKNWEEKWRRDPLGMIVLAAIFIWAGLVLLAENMGLLTSIGVTFRAEEPESWAIIFIGAGLIVLLGVAVRLLVPAYRRAVGGSIIFGAVLFAVGIGMLWGWDVVWPIVLIVIGAGILVGGLLRKR